MEQLTKREEEIMMILWRLKKGFVKDVIAELPKPKPPYNTISSVVRILEKKGFLTHKAYGKTHEYYPAISKKEYKKYTFKNFLKDYFENSYENVVSFIVNEKDISDKEIKEIKEIIDQSENGK